MQASAGARKYAGELFLRNLIDAAIDSYPHIPIVMHQDHGSSPAVCIQAMRLGFSSVMMDGSLMADGKSIADYAYNADVTRHVVDIAHAIGVTVEGELGALGSLETMKGDKEDGHGAEGTMTREAVADRSGRGGAVRQGHGSSTRSRSPSARRTAPTSSRASRTGDILAIDRIKEIHKRIPNTHLVMHGSSSVPQDLLAIIRDYGGDMRETYGVPVEEIQEGIKFGVRKINIDTDIRLAMTAAIRKYLGDNPEKFEPRDYLKPAMLAAKQICKQRYEEFGCAGMASKIKPVNLGVIADRYKKGRARTGRPLSGMSSPRPWARDRATRLHRDCRSDLRRRHRRRFAAAIVPATAPASAAFCPACGQTTALHPPTVGEFVHEFLGHHIAIDGALWRTLAALLLRPGLLTADLLRGPPRALHRAAAPLSDVQSDPVRGERLVRWQSAVRERGRAVQGAAGRRQGRGRRSHRARSACIHDDAYRGRVHRRPDQAHRGDDGRAAWRTPGRRHAGLPAVRADRAGAGGWRCS